ncbi:hypothetical protein GCM10010975_29140 [Comamonas phosphati]|nr:hypothetical protein GCM10010975_29140 [Comamonas phosphati]
MLEQKAVFLQSLFQLPKRQTGMIGQIMGRYAKGFGAQVRLVYDLGMEVLGGDRA